MSIHIEDIHLSTDTYDPAAAATSHKTAYEASAEASPPLTTRYLYERFPTAVRHVGELGASGLVLFNKQGDIVGGVAGPEWTADGGPQREAHVVPWNLRDLGERTETDIARYLVARAQHGWALGSVGVERESWKIDPRHGGRLAAVERDQQIETNRGMLEVVLEPHFVPDVQRRAVFRHIVERYEARQDVIIADTSVPPVGSPNDEGFLINNGHEAEYMRVIHPKLKALANARDPYARQLATYVARRYGRSRRFGPHRFADFDAMHDALPDVRYWGSSARHRSFQLPHFRMDDEPTLVTPSRIAIAIADLYASDMGAIAKLLSFSTPTIFGETPHIKTPNGSRWPRDYRAILQLVLDTAYPGELIGDYPTMLDRITTGVISGTIPSPARGAYLNTQTGVYTYHSDVRVRCDTDGRSGRIENTTMGSTQSIDDEIASDFFLNLLHVSAVEAVAHGQTVAEYFEGKYGGSLATNKNRLDIVHSYNLSGRHGIAARAQIEHCMDYLRHIGHAYRQLEPASTYVQARVHNLTVEPRSNRIADYYYGAHGPFSEVVQGALQDGMSPIEVERQKYTLQYKRATDLI